ncbi:MAG: M20/M25/M40 family metallo-hydrolase [Deltaproteobacteria bacterium]|nr:M20/M25/M40 family metallo-hydrolase [Deltaproteobacteria bacterium]
MNNTCHPVEILKKLIRFNTTNPPGNEGECIGYIKDLMEDIGIEASIYAGVKNRPNLVCRMPGKGDAPPLMFYGHTDVVTTEKQDWKHPPFDGRELDGYVWGRGALDMKGGLAMMISAILAIKKQGTVPAGDIIFAALSDEEAGGDLGAKFLVENHANLFDGVRHAIGEFGGFSMYAQGRTFYPVQVAEKQACWLRAKITGPAGHGAMPMKGGAMGKLGRILTCLDKKRLPVRITPVAREMIETFAGAMSFPANAILKQLLNPKLTDAVLALMGAKGQPFEPLLRNTVNATIVTGGDKVNVIPPEIILSLDGRLVPGATPETFINELAPLLGRDTKIEIIRYDPPPPDSKTDPDTGFMDLISRVIKQADPNGIPMPMLLPGVTDARFFSRLSIRTYGFLPMKLPEDFDFFSTIHAADERVPISALEFGTEVLTDLLRRYGDKTVGG